MKTLFFVFGFLFVTPFSWADDVTDILLSPTITNPALQSRLDEIRNQCGGRDGCETLMGDMNTKASFGETPSLENCPGNGCPVCNESEVCKNMAIKMKSVAAASSRSTEATVKAVSEETSGTKKSAKIGTKKGE